MFLDPPYLLTSNFYSCVKSNNIESFLNLLKYINAVNSKLLYVCGDSFLLNCFYEKYNITKKFQTEFFYIIII